MINDLEINHLGVVVDCDEINEIENRAGVPFIKDDLQGVSVCFVKDDRLNILVEYFTREGRAANYKLGFNHICYNVESQKVMDDIHNDMLTKKTGIRLTLPEKSAASDYCNVVTFYKIFGIGIIEYNILDH